MLPEQLLERDQWLCWRADERDGKQTKIPLVPGTDEFASATDPADWGSFETARKSVAATSADGVGFAFSAEDPLVGVDLDDCRDTETRALDDDAQDIVRRLDSYTEVSPSGTGVHVLVEGFAQDTACKNSIRSLTDKEIIQHVGDIDDFDGWCESILAELELVADDLFGFIEDAQDITIDFTEVPFSVTSSTSCWTSPRTSPSGRPVTQRRTRPIRSGSTRGRCTRARRTR